MASGQQQRLGGTGRLVAVLGPTNTGKTHLAIEQMLRHRTGIMGFPLRLLAREVYDRVVASQGRDVVALVTGEEKIVPPGARYFLCTVESMPLERPVGFVAIDEIQLCADPERGHIFTDRLLHARGTRETWLMGANTIAPLLRELLPGVEISARRRLSRLAHTGVHKLERLAPRSAVVTFSAEGVYALAERLRARHGGAAVVLGALSPRTRNKQVELFQAGEVRHLVATDAIGMGLNLDIHHLALAALRKFDGRGNRELTAAEVAQIAGRAGRWKRDGTFGSTLEAGPIDAEVVSAVEQHLFPPLRRLFWRSRDLDFSTVEALRLSLQQPSPSPRLVRVRDAEDERVLAGLAALEEVTSRAQGNQAVDRLWELAQVPDFSKSLTSAHVELLSTVWRHLCDDGAVPSSVVAGQLERLDRTWGDVETLMARIAAIRTWTYLSHRGDWLAEPGLWQERTRAVEDRLSDALHEALTLRFVDVRRSVLIAGHRTVGRGVAVEEDGTVRLADEALGVLRGLRFTPATEVQLAEDLRAALRRALRPALTRRLQALRKEDLSVDGSGWLRWRGGSLARLGAASGARVRLEVVRLELLEPAERQQVRALLDSWLRDRLESLSLQVPGDASPAVKGLFFALEQALGTVSRAQVASLCAELDGRDRQQLARAGVALGRTWVYVRSWWWGLPWEARQLLGGLGGPIRPWPAAPSSGVVLLRGGERLPLDSWGYAKLGHLGVRVDVAESLSALARRRARSGGSWVDSELQAVCGLGRADTAALLRALGFTVRSRQGAFRLERRVRGDRG